ncbi:unnamed protein product [Tuber aestivum]|uniref:Uncharacterized protein n=1 Tax=Tuber aestivum TaxID=59557 RepID=A0A292PZJ4_9PEZI|nr:unnamed protein product [Tuber aestivum]
MSDSPEEVLAPTSPQSLAITLMVGETSSAADHDPIKETHREEQKEAVKKPSVTGTARRPAGAGSSATAPASGLPPRRTGTSLSKPPQRSTAGTNGATGTASNAATRRTVSGSASSTANNPPTVGSRGATISGISRRTSTIASPAANTPRSPEKKGMPPSSSSSTSPTADRRTAAGSTAGAAGNVRRAATSTTTPTASTHRSRPSMSNTVTAGRPSAASNARENAVSPRPPSAAGRLIPATARGAPRTSSLSSRPSTSTLRSRTMGPSGPVSASSANSSKELEALKVKVSGLEEKNKELSEKLSKAGSHSATNGDAKTATEELESELADLKARITTIQEANEKLQTQCKDAETKCETFAALVEESAATMRDTNDKIIARHAEERKALEGGFDAKEKDLLAQINALKASFESLEARHAEEVSNNTSLAEKAAAETDDLQKAIEAREAAYNKAVEALNAALVAEKEANSRSSIDAEGLVKELTEEISALKKRIEDEDEVSKGVAEKNLEALESRQKEIDGLSNVIKLLQEELESVMLENKAGEQKAIQELQEKHAAELEAVDAEKTAAEEAKVKLEKLIQEHREQLEKSSETLSTQLQEAKSSAKELEKDLLLKIEATKLEGAKALETAQEKAAEEIEAVRQESESQQKQLELTIEALEKEASGSAESKDKEWENKIDQLTKSNQDQVSSLTAQLDTAREEIQGALRKLELVEHHSAGEIKSAQEQSKEEVTTLQNTLGALDKELADKEDQLAKFRVDLERAVKDIADSAERGSKLEETHKAALDSQRAEHVTEIEKMRAELTSSNEGKYTLLSDKHEALVAELDSTREAHNVEILRMAGELKKAEESISQLLQSHSSTISSLEDKCAIEKASRVELQAALDAVPDQSAFDALSQQLEITKAELDEIKTSKDAEIKRLQESLQEAEESKSGLESEVAKEKASNQELLERVSALEIEVSEAQKEVVEKTAAVEKSDEEVRGLRASMEADCKSIEKIYQIELDELKREAKGLKDKLGSEKKEVETTLAALEKVKDLEMEKKALEEENATLVDGNGALGREMETLKEEQEASMASITSELESLKGELSILKEEKETALQAMKAKEADLEKANHLVSSLEADSTEKSNSLETTTKEKSDFEAEIKQLKEQVESSKELIKIKESAIEMAIKGSEGAETTLKEQLDAAKALVKEKETALINSQKESAAKMKVVEAQLAELKLQIKNQVSTENGSSRGGEAGETSEVKKIPIIGIVAALKTQLGQLQADNEEITRENTRMLKMIESLPLGSTSDQG